MVTGYGPSGISVRGHILSLPAQGTSSPTSAYSLSGTASRCSWGVLGGIHANSYVVDAIIGFSVVYKAFDNHGRIQALLGASNQTLNLQF